MLRSGFRGLGFRFGVYGVLALGLFVRRYHLYPYDRGLWGVSTDPVWVITVLLTVQLGLMTAGLLVLCFRGRGSYAGATSVRSAAFKLLNPTLNQYFKIVRSYDLPQSPQLPRLQEQLPLCSVFYTVRVIRRLWFSPSVLRIL